MRVDVDGKKCMGYGVCNEVAPDVFELDAQGFAITPEEPVPPEREEQAREAARRCPVKAITVHADGPPPPR